MSRTPDLFGDKPRRPSRKMMTVSDHGINDCGGDDYPLIAQFQCAKCGHESEWMDCKNISEIKRGIPCPICNQPPSASL